MKDESVSNQFSKKMSVGTPSCRPLWNTGLSLSPSDCLENQKQRDALFENLPLPPHPFCCVGDCFFLISKGGFPKSLQLNL